MLSTLRLGRVAIGRAKRILPGEAEGLAEGEARLLDLETAVRAGRTPAEVAAPFQRFASMNGRCAYTPIEIVVIVIGFVLGIIPGIIFLFVFC